MSKKKQIAKHPVKQEQRAYVGSELRAARESGDTGARTLEGYAAVFNSWSQDLGGFREKIRPGAFSRTIKEKQDVRFLFNHNPDIVLGRTTAGTLVLSQDSKGLAFRCTLPDTQMARDLHESIQRGDISQCSFSFAVAPNGQVWGEAREGSGPYFASRELTDVDTFDTSVVTYPAYSNTSVGARVLSEIIPAEIRSSVAARNGDMAAEPSEIKKAKMAKKAAKKAYRKAKAAYKMAKQAADAAKAERTLGGNTKDISGITLEAKVAKAHMVQAEAAYRKAQESVRTMMQGPMPIDDCDISETDIPANWTPEQKQAFITTFKSAYAKAREEGLKWKAAFVKAMAGAYMGTHEMMTGKPVVGTEQQPASWADTDKDGNAVFQNMINLMAEQRVYKTAADVPEYVPETKKAQWMEVWNSVYKKLIKKGKSKKAAEKSAFKQANGVAGPNGGSDGKPPVAEKRDMDCYEHLAREINCAIADKFGMDEHGWAKYYVIETYADHVICCSGGGPGPNDYVRIEYTVDEATDTVTLSDAQPMKMVYVPTDGRSLKLARINAANRMKGDDVDVIDPGPNEPGEDDDEIEDRGEIDPAALAAAGHVEGGDCDNVTCPCQNRVFFDGSTGRSVGQATVENRGSGARTKRVGGKDLTAKYFAFVGDPDRTETWKYPIHDADHVRNALSRWGQHKGIPSDKEAGVLAKIHAAAKKFGITVSGENSVLLASEERKAMVEDYRRRGLALL